jgi:hypothetical protein
MLEARMSEIRFEALQRVEAAHLLASASGHSFDDSILIVAALENDGVFIVREVNADVES